MEHLKPVRKGVQFRFTPLGSVAIVHNHIFNLHIIVDRMDGHFRLYLKTCGKHWESFYKAVAERAVPCHNVLDITMEKPVDAAAHDGVAKIVERSFILRKISGGKPVSHHHVRAVEKHLIHHFPRILHGIGIVSVHHDIALRLYLAEHSAHHISFSLHMLIADHRTGIPRKFYRSIAGIIIVDIDHCLRQCLSGIPNYLRNSLFLIITGNQYCYLIHSPSPVLIILLFSLPQFSNLYYLIF